jgi:predicted double-glycine peptidase
VSGVPPVRQDNEYACGPACVAAVAAHCGIALTDFASGHPQLAGDATGRDLQTLAEELGLQAFVYRGSMNDLQENLMKGRPLIVMIPKPVMEPRGWIATPIVNLWNEFGRRPAHWVVVVGFVEGSQVILHDPASGPLVVKQETFRNWWAKKDNLCVLIAASDGDDRLAIQ